MSKEVKSLLSKIKFIVWNRPFTIKSLGLAEVIFAIVPLKEFVGDAISAALVVFGMLAFVYGEIKWQQRLRKGY